MSKGFIPLLRGGGAAPLNKMPRYLKQGAAGEVRIVWQQAFDLPGSAESKVALHFDRRCRPSSKEGINRLIPTGCRQTNPQ